MTTTGPCPTSLYHPLVRSMLGMLVALALMLGNPGTSRADFVRGDVNEDDIVDISDAQALIAWLFQGGEEPACGDSADVNDDGVVDISDPSYLFAFLFLGGQAPPEPFLEPGIDLTQDDPFDCGDRSCTPLTCEQAGVSCGIAADGCGGELHCGGDCSQTTRSCAGSAIDSWACECTEEGGCDCSWDRNSCGGGFSSYCIDSSLLMQATGGGGCRSNGGNGAYCPASGQRRVLCRGSCRNGTARSAARCSSGTYSCTTHDDCRRRNRFSYCSAGVCAR